MLQRFFCGGKLPNISNLALVGRKGSSGCSSMFNKESMKLQGEVITLSFTLSASAPF